MKKEYFSVYFGEDGITITPYDKKGIEKLIDSLTEEEDIECPFIGEANEDGSYYVDGGIYPIYKHMIIKGEIIMPQPVETVKKYKI